VADLLGALASAGRAVHRAEGPIARGALNVATLGTYEHPHDTSRYLVDTLRSFDPRTRGGAISLGTLLVPGAGRGIPTRAQQQFLDAIRLSSKGRQAGFNPLDPGVKALANAGGMNPRGEPSHIGAPMGQQDYFGATMNPLYYLLKHYAGDEVHQGRAVLGISRNEPLAAAFPGKMPGAVEEHYQTTPMDNAFFNMLDLIEKGGRRN